MITSRLILTGIRAAGRHGASPGERGWAQEFLVDLEVTVEVGEDSLDATADYGALVEAARRTVEGTSFELLETLADAVARSVLEFPGVTQVVATVHKPGAARTLGVEDVAAEAAVE